MPYENAHAAFIDDDNIVRQVIVIPYCDDDDDTITAYCNSIGLEGRWIDTSYLGARRGKYAGIGDTFDPDLDEFVSPAVSVVDELESE
jgi:hypothetical protein